MARFTRLRPFLLNKFIVQSYYTMNVLRTRKKRPFIYSWVFLIFLGFILGISLRAAFASFSKKKHADIERDKYELRKEDILEKKENLEGKIEALKTDRGIEAELRSRFNITKEGETMIRVIENEPEEENPTGDDIEE